MISKKGMGVGLLVVLVLAILIIVLTVAAILTGWGPFSALIADCRGECKAQCGQGEISLSSGNVCMKDGKRIEGTVCCSSGVNLGGGGGGPGGTSNGSGVNSSGTKPGILEIRMNDAWGSKVFASTQTFAYVGSPTKYNVWGTGTSARTCTLRLLDQTKNIYNNIKIENMPCVPSQFTGDVPNVVLSVMLLPNMNDQGKVFTLETVLFDDKGAQIASSNINLFVQCPMDCANIAMQQICSDPEVKSKCAMDCAWTNNACAEKTGGNPGNITA